MGEFNVVLENWSGASPVKGRVSVPNLDTRDHVVTSFVTDVLCVAKLAIATHFFTTMNSARTNTPLTGNSQFIPAGRHLPVQLTWYLTHCCFSYSLDDDELDEDSLPSFSIGPPPPDKGKGRARAPEQLAPPSNNVGTSSPALAGRIGSSANGAAPTRQTVGGVQVETRCVLIVPQTIFIWSHFEHRYTGADTLDEPVTTTIVCSTGHNNFSELTDILHVGSRSFVHILKISASLVSSEIERS